MFWLLLVAISGLSFLIKRYRSVHDKKVFFRSSLFQSIAGSISMLLLAWLIVNIFIFDSSRDSYDQETAYALTTEERDTSYVNFVQQDPAFHYNLIVKLSNKFNSLDGELNVKERYLQFCSSADPKICSLGNFCLGVFALHSDNLKEAIFYFDRVPDRDFPYLHFCRGVIYQREKKPDHAEKQFKEELKLENGNFAGSFAKLQQLYEANENYPGLRELINYETASTSLPDELARTTLLHTGDVLDYMIRVCKSVKNKTNFAGLIAAMAISILWMVYIIRLNIFRRNSIVPVLLIFLSGMLSVFVMISFNDIFHIISPWSLNGSYLNDLLYAIFIIGVPEEFTKIFPLLVLLLFAGALREPIDYIICASASALGFAFIENLLYFDEIDNGIIHGRAYFAVLGHMIDSSFVAYGFVLSKFHHTKKISVRYTLPVSFGAASITHGIYDLLVFQGLNWLFFIFFIFVMQIWIVIINNCLNNSAYFSYKLAPKCDRPGRYIAISLTAIFVLEYLLVGFREGRSAANMALYSNIFFTSILIGFFSPNLSSFDLVKGYWRNVSFRNREKRGYGTRSPITPLIGWYFVNSIQAHNYAGMKIKLANDRYNKVLAEVMEGDYEGKIVTRVILYDGAEPDPHWFVVKLEKPVPLETAHQEYVLIKLRYQEDSLLHEDDVEVFFKGIADGKELKRAQPQKKRFPFFGWANASLLPSP